MNEKSKNHFNSLEIEKERERNCQNNIKINTWQATRLMRRITKA